MREDEFKVWLAERGANTQAGRNTRAYAVRTIENNLAALGSPHADLDAAWQADRFDGLRQRIKDIQQDFRAGGTDYRILMPQSEKPDNRLASWRSWLGQYGQFLSGEGDSTDRRNEDLKHLVSTLGRREIDAAIELCEDEGLDAFLANRGFRPPQRWIVTEGGRYPAKAIVAAAVSFLPDGMELTVKTYFGGWGEPEAFACLEALGYTLVSDNTKQPTPVWIVTARWGAEDGVQRFVDRGEWSLLTDTGSANNDRMRQMQPGDRIVMRDYFHQSQGLPFEANGARISAIRIRAMGTVTEQRGDGLSVGVDWETPLPEPRVWYFYTQNDPVWWLKEPGESPLADRLRAFLLDGAEQDYAYFLDQWFGSEPVQGERPMPSPTNLILYGPPGTGKTYTTAREAVRLCGEAVPEDRDALMALYRSLQHKGRIGFVTFHQNFAYEDFVEGLRPVTGDGGEAGAGFGLSPEPGVFRRIADMAARPAASEAAFSFEGRRIFKLSLGESGKAAWNWVYEQSIEDGYALFGFRDVDWSDEAFSSRDAILAELQGLFPDEKITPQTGIVKSPDRFRNQIGIGDVVIISKGLNAFRAIGVVEGEYEYAPREGGSYCHRRKVRWLWEEPEGVPVGEISATRFSLDTVYELPRERLNLDVLQRYIAGADADAQDTGTLLPHVLIIDEINRANISKVFGELITLLEPDKRLGMPNALTVRLPYSKTEFGVPANLHVIGTMNTADRSIALLDTALRRRFDFREMAPDPSLLGTVDGIALPAVLTTINERIEYLVDREHRIGHAFFIHCATRDDVNAVMRDKVIPLLQEYFFEDWSRIAAVVGPGFIEGRKLKAPPGMADLGPRDTWSVRAVFPPDAYASLVGGAEASVEASAEPDIEIAAE